MAGSKTVVLAALVANAAITVMKFFGYLLTGSPSMLSETYHSISDTGNQVLLLVGLQFSKREVTREHPFGWGKAEFFYGFVVAVLLFGIAGWESLREGWHHLQEARAGAVEHIGGHSAHILGFTVPAVYVSYGILALAFLFELYALSKARQGMLASQRRGRYSNMWETFRHTKNAAILTAFTEDTLALIGLVVAAAALALTQLTGNPMWDAAGAIVIGILLMGFALLLAWEQKRLILGEAMEPWQEDAIRDIITAQAGVTGVHDLRTVYFGPNTVLLTADVHFEPHVAAADVADAVDQAEAGIRRAFPTVGKIYLETHDGGHAPAVEESGEAAEGA